jgi:hypothetical protein
MERCYYCDHGWNDAMNKFMVPYAVRRLKISESITRAFNLKALVI